MVDQRFERNARAEVFLQVVSARRALLQTWLPPGSPCYLEPAISCGLHSKVQRL